MLEGITWKTYLTVIILTVIIYYAFVGLLYYRPELKKMLSRKSEAEEEEEGEFIDVGGIDELEKIVEDMRHSILEQAGDEATKEQLLAQFASRLANYGGLRQPAYRNAINNYLIEHSQIICGISITEQELEETWQGLDGQQ